MDLIQSFINSVFKSAPDACKMCLGDGRLSRDGKLSNPPIQCPRCKGTGKEPTPEPSSNPCKLPDKGRK